ncbi:hypothetical protein CBL_00215 [Carabus blaptoides fortunei]
MYGFGAFFPTMRITNHDHLAHKSLCTSLCPSVGDPWIRLEGLRSRRANIINRPITDGTSVAGTWAANAAREREQRGYIEEVEPAMILHVRFKGNRNDGCNRATHCLSNDSLLGSFTLNTSPGVKQIHKYAHPGSLGATYATVQSRAATVTLIRVSQPPAHQQPINQPHTHGYREFIVARSCTIAPAPGALAHHHQHHGDDSLCILCSQYTLNGNHQLAEPAGEEILYADLYAVLIKKYDSILKLL